MKQSPAHSRSDIATLTGRYPDQLTYAEHRHFAGAWLAFELYSPQTLPFRRIEAAAESVDGCIAALTARGLNPRHYEFVLLENLPAA